MYTIEASEFKARCLSLMDEVASTGEPILITKDGRPVAELRPHAGARRALPFGIHKGAVHITGDIISPPDDAEWEAMK